MKPQEHQRLLKAILAEEDAGNFQQTSLEHGLTFLRQQRRRRYLARSDALVAVLCLVILELVKWNHSARRDGFGPQLSSTRHPVPALPNQVKFISDDELLALFPGRPVALIGKPGRQQLVFLDQTQSTSAPSSF
ncbi:MAG TPA: hypothetical protein VH597_04995 [Verrucomicrobiae bacterium]|jgi:hypothetical protein|nr:hypothetical protein [Verrucomicrobiae bacterium]